jgi:hypothetical protein
VGKSEGKRPLGRPKHRFMDNIKMGISRIAAKLAVLRGGLNSM